MRRGINESRTELVHFLPLPNPVILLWVSSLNQEKWYYRKLVCLSRELFLFAITSSQNGIFSFSVLTVEIGLWVVLRSQFRKVNDQVPSSTPTFTNSRYRIIFLKVTDIYKWNTLFLIIDDLYDGFLLYKKMSTKSNTFIKF